MKNTVPGFFGHNAYPNAYLDISENPLREFNRMQRDMNRWFDEMAPLRSSSRWPAGALDRSEFVPACDVVEKQNHYIMSIDIPGVKKEDVKIDLQDNILTITGSRGYESEEKAWGRKYSERAYGSFTRAFTIPAGVKPDQIQAEYKEGVLYVAFPKMAAARGQQIRVGETKPGFFDRLLGHKKDEAVKVA